MGFTKHYMYGIEWDMYKKLFKGLHVDLMLIHVDFMLISRV